MTQIPSNIPNRSPIHLIKYSPAQKLLALAVAGHVYVCGEDPQHGWQLIEKLEPFGDSGTVVSSMAFIGRHADQLFVGGADGFR